MGRNVLLKLSFAMRSAWATFALLTGIALAVVCTWIVLTDNFWGSPVSKVSRFDAYKDIKKILLWNNFFGASDWHMLPPNQSEVLINCPLPCLISIDRREPLAFDALVLHTRDPHMQPPARDPHQVYIAYTWESPAYRDDKFRRGTHFYNWSATYHRHSDIVMTYGRWNERGPDDNADSILPQLTARLTSTQTTTATPAALTWSSPMQLLLPNATTTATATAPSKVAASNGEAFVAWVVSNCRTESRREDYVTQLRRYLPVDIFGRCGQRCHPETGGPSSESCLQMIAARGQYKFYLAFENSACEDYITEKAFRPLKFGLVPIVFGGKQSSDYEKALPPSSYIDVRTFRRPQELAEYLRMLNGDPKAYLAYHEWRKKYTVTGPDNAFCLICNKLYSLKTSLNSTHSVDFGNYWKPESLCDSKLFASVTVKENPRIRKP